MERNQFEIIKAKLLQQLSLCESKIENFDQVSSTLNDIYYSLKKSNASRTLNKSQKLFMIEYLLNCAQLCANRLQELNRKIRGNSYFYMQYLSVLDIDHPKECLMTCLRLLNIIGFDNIKTNMLEAIKLFQRIYGLIESVPDRVHLIQLINLCARKISLEENKFVINFLNSIVNFPNRDKKTKICIEAAKAVISCLSNNSDITIVINWLRYFLLPLLKDGNFNIVAIRIEGNSSSGESIIKHLFRQFKSSHCAKEILCFLFEQLNHHDLEIRKTISIIFSSPEKHRLPLNLFTMEELHIIQNKIYGLLLNETLIDDQISKYIHNLFALMRILELYDNSSLFKSNRITLVLDLLIEKSQNPFVIRYCILDMLNEIKEVLLINKHASRLIKLIARLSELLACPDDEILDSSFMFLRRLAQEPELTFIEQNKSYLSYKITREQSTQDYLDQYQAQTYYDNKLKVIFEQKKSFGLDVKDVLNSLLKYILNAEMENQAERAWHLVFDDFFTDKNDGALFIGTKEAIEFFCYVYTKSSYSYLQYAATEILIQSINYLYNNHKYISSDIIFVLSSLKIKSFHMEIIEQITCFLRVIELNFPDLSNDAKRGFEKILRNHPHVLFVKHRDNLFNKSINASISILFWKDQSLRTIQKFYKKQYDSAISIYQILVKQSSSYNALFYQIELAYCLWKKGDKNGARQLFDDIVKQNCNTYYVYFHRAVFLFESELDYQQSENDLILAAKCYDLYAPIFYYRALVRERLKDIASAIYYLEMALSIRPAYREALDKKIELHYRTSDWVMARIAYQQAILYFSNYTEFTEKRVQSITRDTELTYIPFSDEFNGISKMLKSMDDNLWLDVQKVCDLAKNILDKFSSFLTEDIIEYCITYYPLQSIQDESLQPHERHRFLHDFISLVIRKTVWFEFHQRYEFFQSKQDHKKLISLIKESKIENIFKVTDPEKLYELISTYCEVYSMQEFLEKYLSSTELQDGYAVGISKDLAKTYSIFPKILGLHHWEAAYGMYGISSQNNHTKLFFENILNTKKKIVFFVPTEIGNERYKDKVTYEEVKQLAEMLYQAPQRLKNVIFVFDAYNFLPLYILSKNSSNELLDFDTEQSFEEIKLFLLNYVVPPIEHAKFVQVYYENIQFYSRRNIRGFIHSQLSYIIQYVNTSFDLPDNIFINLTQTIDKLFAPNNLPLSEVSINSFYSVMNSYVYVNNANIYDKISRIKRKIVLQFIFTLLSDEQFSQYINPDNKYIKKVIEYLDVVKNLMLENKEGKMLFSDCLKKMLQLYEDTTNKELASIIMNVSQLIKLEQDSCNISNETCLLLKSAPSLQINPLREKAFVFIAESQLDKNTLGSAEKNWNLRINELTNAFNQISVIVPKVRYGLFAGQLPRDLRKIGYELNRILLKPDEIESALVNIIEISSCNNLTFISRLASKCQSAFFAYEKYKILSVYKNVLHATI